MFCKRILRVVFMSIMVLALWTQYGEAAPKAEEFTFLLEAGKSYEITNTSGEYIVIGSHASTRAAYDIVRYDAAGKSDYLARNARGDIYSYGKDKIRITVVSTFPMECYVRKEDEKRLIISEINIPAFYYFTLQAGSRYEIVNTTPDGITIYAHISDGNAGYSIVRYDAKGAVDYQNEKSHYDIYLYDRNTAFITVRDASPIRCFMKYEDAEKLTGIPAMSEWHRVSDEDAKGVMASVTPKKQAGDTTSMPMVTVSPLGEAFAAGSLKGIGQGKATISPHNQTEVTTSAPIGAETIDIAELIKAMKKRDNNIVVSGYLKGVDQLNELTAKSKYKFNGVRVRSINCVWFTQLKIQQTEGLGGKAVKRDDWVNASSYGDYTAHVHPGLNIQLDDLASVSDILDLLENPEPDAKIILYMDGHTMMIDAIVDGNVYYTDNWEASDVYYGGTDIEVKQLSVQKFFTKFNMTLEKAVVLTKD